MADDNEQIEREIEEEFCDVGIDVEGNLVYLEKCKFNIKAK